MKRVHGGLVLVAMALLLLQGCSGGAVREGDEAPVDEQSLGAETGTAQVGVGTFNGVPIAEALNDPDSVLSRRVFYFDFNSSELSEADRQALNTHAELLATNPDLAVVLEGHADERGSREYNLALGERRAQAIERVLSLQGVDREQIQVISFGEERPVALGHDEQAWRLNRRVELLYSGY
jgi:peptidoglycan-associated lipoprotein